MVYELEIVSGEELSRLIDSGRSTVVVPFGSMEHHGGHLPIGADALLADAVGREVARRLDAVLAPTVRIGRAEQHMPFTGTLTLRAATLTNVAIELAESLVRQGFAVIALVSTHGGNRAPLDAAVAYLDMSLEGAVVCAPRGDVGPDPGAHSGRWLTSVMLVLRPELVAPDNASPDIAEEVRAAQARRGTVLFERFVAGIVEDVRAASRRG